MSSTRTHSRRSDHSDTKISDRSRHSRASSRSRTSSRSRQSETNYSDYSDDFEAETKSRGRNSARTIDSKKSTRGTPRSSYTSNRLTIDLHSSATTRRSYNVYGNTRRRNRPLRKSNSAPKSKTSGSKKRNPVAIQMLTAKQQELNELQNSLYDVKQKLETAEKENKLLKTLQHRQDKAIRKFENAENDLPRLISRNFEDQRVLKMKLRKTQETKRALESKMAENNEEMLKMEGVLRRLKKMVYDKNLGERSELSKQLSDAEHSLSKAEQNIKDLDKKLDLKITSYTRQLNNERQKHKETREKLDKLHEDLIMTDARLKEKERALNVSNIYSMRKKGSPEKALVLVTSTPKSNDSTSTQTDLALTFTPEVKGHSQTIKTKAESTSPSLNKLHSDTFRTLDKNTKTSIFLTTDFESPMSSPSVSFIDEKTKRSLENFPGKIGEIEDSFTGDLKKTEDEIKKLQIALKQKADLLSKIQNIDVENSSTSSQLKSTGSASESQNQSLKSRADLVRSLFDSDDSKDTENDFDLILKPTKIEEPPKKPEREISFGSYAPTVGGVARRKPVANITKTPMKPLTPTLDIDEPLFDLSSGKQNKKSDLLTQLFG